MAKMIIVQATMMDRAQPVAEKMLHQESDGECRQRGHGDEQCEPRAIIHTSAEQAAEARQHRQYIAPKVDQDGNQRSDMGGHVDSEALIRPAGDTRHQNQVTRRTDGQEFRDALHKGENDDMQQRHSAPPAAAGGGAPPLIALARAPFGGINLVPF